LERGQPFSQATGGEVEKDPHSRGRRAAPGANPDLAQRVAAPDCKAKPERFLLLHVEAFDWNCPQRITPRFTAAEIDMGLQPLRQRLGALEAENAALRGRSSPQRKTQNERTRTPAVAAFRHGRIRRAKGSPRRGRLELARPATGGAGLQFAGAASPRRVASRKRSGFADATRHDVGGLRNRRSAIEAPREPTSGC
jgi:hypothetical protein